jgi:predicted phosphoribosyltransferase
MVMFVDRLEAGEILAKKFGRLKSKLKHPLMLSIPRKVFPLVSL